MKFITYTVIIILSVCVGTCLAGPNVIGDFVMCNFGEDVDQVGTVHQSSDEPEAALVTIYLDGQGNGTWQEQYVFIRNT